MSPRRSRRGTVVPAVSRKIRDLFEWKGALLVADGMESNLKLYDTDTGALLRVIGRPGSGPGEFRTLGAAAATPDGGLVAFDQNLGRVTRFGADGEPRDSWTNPGAFAFGMGVLPGGDLVVGGQLMADGNVLSDSAVHRFSPAGERLGSWFVRPEPTHYGEEMLNGMRAITVGSWVVALQQTTNVALLHDVATGRTRADSLGTAFHRPIEWVLEHPADVDDFQEWMATQHFAWWLRALDDRTYAAGFSVPADSAGETRIRWVFASPESGPFAESEPTDAQPAFIRDGRLYSVRIRPDGRTELIIGEAP